MWHSNTAWPPRVAGEQALTASPCSSPIRYRDLRPWQLFGEALERTLVSIGSSVTPLTKVRRHAAQLLTYLPLSVWPVSTTSRRCCSSPP